MATQTERGERLDRIRIEYDLTFESLFHCGTGLRSGLIDRTVVRDGQGYLYVPGTTFKGVLRQHCEQVAQVFANEDYISPHDTGRALLGLGTRKPTLITRIFGSQNSPGKLFFDDARQTEEALLQYDGHGSNERENRGRYKHLQVSEYTQVRLDRPTRTAVPGALYTSEFGTRNMAFKGVIQGWLKCRAIEHDIFSASTASQQAGGDPTYSLLLLLAGLHMVDHIGGNKSTGKGKCRCTITALTLNEHICEEEQWQSWLDRLDALAYYNQDGEGK